MKDHYQVLGVVSEAEDKKKVADFLRSVECDSLPVLFVPNKMLEAYKLTMTPISLVVRNTGEVEKSWLGKWGPDTLPAASAFFGVSLK